MTDASRTQGWAICIGAGIMAFLFLIGILNGSYWAVALPVAVLVFFVLGLAAWVGYTIATIQTDAEPARPTETARPAEPTELPSPAPREVEPIGQAASDGTAS